MSSDLERAPGARSPDRLAMSFWMYPSHFMSYNGVKIPNIFVHTYTYSEFHPMPWRPCPAGCPTQGSVVTLQTEASFAQSPNATPEAVAVFVPSKYAFITSRGAVTSSRHSLRVALLVRRVGTAARHHHHKLFIVDPARVVQIERLEGAREQI